MSNDRENVPPEGTKPPPLTPVTPDLGEEPPDIVGDLEGLLDEPDPDGGDLGVDPDRLGVDLEDDDSLIAGFGKDAAGEGDSPDLVPAPYHLDGSSGLGVARLGPSDDGATAGDEGETATFTRQGATATEEEGEATTNFRRPSTPPPLLVDGDGDNEEDQAPPIDDD